MKGSARRLVYFASVTAVSGLAVVAIMNCGGGEHPAVATDPIKEAGPAAEAGPSIIFSGFDDKTGITFGDNGFVNCGTQAGDKIITLKNTTDEVINFTASLTSGSAFYKLTPDTGGIPLHGQATIQINPVPIPQESDVAPDLYAGTLQIQLSTGDAPTVIRLHQTARGAIVTSTVGTNGIDFGNVKANTSADQLFSLTNAGNMEVTASFLLGTQQFKVDGATSGTAKLGPAETVSKTVTFKPDDLQPFTDTLAISYNTSAVHCKTPPGNVTLKGTGTSSVTVTPGTLDYGQIDCGTTAAYQTVTISSTVDTTFIPTIAGGVTKYTLEDGSGNPVNVGNPVNLSATVPYSLRVKPKAVPIPSVVTPNGLGDTLTIHTNADNTDHTVTLKETARGAILAVTPTSIVRTNQSLNTILNEPVSVVNTGNLPANFTLAVTDLSNPSGGSLSLNLTSGSALVGSTPGQLTATMPGTFNATILANLSLGVTGGAVLCQDLPPKYPLQFQTAATGVSVTVSPGSLNFGQVDCGGTAAAFQTLTITSIVNTTITPTLGSGAASAFSLADNSGTALVLGTPISLTANVPYTMRVVPKPVGIPSPTSNNGLGDTLTLTTPADASPKTIALSETAHGAVFSFSPTLISGKEGTITNFNLVNTGNASGNYTLTTNGPNTLTNGGAAGPSINGTALPGSTLATLQINANGTVAVTTTSTRCADLPPPIQITDTGM